MIVGCSQTMPEASQERVKTLLWGGMRLGDAGNQGPALKK